MAPDIEPYDEPYAEHDGSNTLAEFERRGKHGEKAPPQPMTTD